MTVTALLSVLVLGHEKLGHRGGGADGQDHLAVLRGRDVGTVVVLAGVKQGGAGRLDSPTGAIASTVVVVVVAMAMSAISARLDGTTTLTAIAAAEVDGPQDLVALSITTTGTTGNDLHGALITATSLVSTGSSRGAGGGGSTVGALLAVSTMSSVSVSAVASIVSVAGADQAGAQQNRQGLKIDRKGKLTFGTFYFSGTGSAHGHLEGILTANLFMAIIFFGGRSLLGTVGTINKLNGKHTSFYKRVYCCTRNVISPRNLSRIGH